MPAKKQKHPLPEHMTFVPSTGYYRYQRKVPRDLAELVGRKKWEHSLGKDPARAFERHVRFKRAHDLQIQALREPEIAENKRRKDADRAEAEKLIEKFGEDYTSPLSWRDTERVLNEARDIPAGSLWNERDYLAMFLSVAFDDASAVERKEISSAVLRVQSLFRSTVTPTTDIEHTMFAALRDMVKKRISDLEGSAPMDQQFLLSAMREEYIKIKGLSENSARSVRTKTNRLITALGDRTLDSYPADELRDFRDTLLEDGLRPSSVGAYLNATKHIVTDAIKDERIPGFDANPFDRVSVPKEVRSIEERRWKRFDEDEIKVVWEAVKTAWGPSAKSRFSESRRAAFLMVFRVLLYTAMRPAEVFWLREHGRVRKDVIEVKRTKTKTARDLPLSKHINDFFDFMQADGLGDCANDSIANTMSESFTEIIRAAGLNGSKHVLYSTKDTLVDRLQRLPGTSDDIIRGMTGHASGQGHLRNYKTRLNDTPQGLAILRRAVDSITYW